MLDSSLVASRLPSSPIESGGDDRGALSAEWGCAAPALLFLAAATACGDPRPELAPPNFVVISVDTLRADHLASYGYERFTSPHIDALAALGAVLDNVMRTTRGRFPPMYRC